MCALTFYYFTVLRVDYTKTTLLDLSPHPDATEYFAQAKALLRDGWPSIQIGYEKLPSRYPFGYPALMLPWLKILPEADAGPAPFRTSQTVGLLLLLAVFAFYTYLAMPLTGGFAALLLATLPGFFTFCRSSLSDLSASVLICTSIYVCILGAQGRTPLENLFVSSLPRPFTEHPNSVAVLCTFIAGHGRVPNERDASALAAPLRCSCGCFPLAASPVLVLNTIQFHSPLKTGTTSGRRISVRSTFSFYSDMCRETQASSGSSSLCSRTRMTRPTSSARVLPLFRPSSF